MEDVKAMGRARRSRPDEEGSSVPDRTQVLRKVRYIVGVSRQRTWTMDSTVLCRTGSCTVAEGGESGLATPTQAEAVDVQQPTQQPRPTVTGLCCPVRAVCSVLFVPLFAGGLGMG